MNSSFSSSLLTGHVHTGKTPHRSLSSSAVVSGSLHHITWVNWLRAFIQWNHSLQIDQSLVGGIFVRLQMANIHIDCWYDWQNSSPTTKSIVFSYSKIKVLLLFHFGFHKHVNLFHSCSNSQLFVCHNVHHLLIKFRKEVDCIKIQWFCVWTVL